MTDTATMAPAVATDAGPSTPSSVEAPITTEATQPRDPSGKFAKTDAAAPAEPSAEAVDPPKDGDTATDAETTETPEQKTEKDRRKQSAQDRIKQLTAQKYDAIARAERAEKRALEQHKQLQELHKSDEYDPVTDMRKAVKAESFEESKAELVEARKAAQQASVAEFSAKVDIARETIPDIDQVVGVFGKIPLSDAACDVVASSTKAAEIAYFLGQNPNEGYRIANLPVYLQTAEIARLEGRLTTPKPKTVSTAPKPASTLSGGANPLQFDAARASVDDMAAQLRKAGIIR